MARARGVDASQAIIDQAGPSGFWDLAGSHATSSQGSPFISLTSDPDVAAYFARGVSQNQRGVVTEFRIPTELVERNYDNFQFIEVLKRLKGSE